MSGPTEQECLNLWYQYHDTGNIEARDRLLTSLTPIVHTLAYRQAHSYNNENLISVGHEALLNALDRYEAGDGKKALRSYVWAYVRYAILDELRRNDWCSRSVRRATREHQVAADRFSVLHDRKPSQRELADTLGITVRTLDAHAVDVQRARVGSLNIPRGDPEDHTELVDTLASADVAPEDVALRADARKRLHAAIAALSSREQRVIALLYVKHHTLLNAGLLMGVSETRVFQIHARAKDKLQRALRKDDVTTLLGC